MNLSLLPQNAALHFIGIGGVGVSALAQAALAMGLKVQGSDLEENALTSKLKNLGATVFLGHHPDNVKDASLIVHSTAVTQHNVERQHAEKMGVTQISRGEFLAQLCNQKDTLTVVGTHGKTTTTALIAHILKENDFDPTAFIGGHSYNLHNNFHIGNGNFWVCESDESDGSFQFLKPHSAIFTHLEADHLDYWTDLSAIAQSFLDFAKQNVQKNTIICTDVPALQELSLRLSNAISYGLNPNAHYQAKNLKHDEINTYFDLFIDAKHAERFKISLIGQHNVCNSTGAIALCHQLGLSLTQIREALASFKGVKRRFSLVGQVNDTFIYDDYAHHPTEIQQTLMAVKAAFPQKRLVVVFQPHRYSRTKHFLDEFAQSFSLCDKVFISNIYAAQESNLYQVSAQDLALKISQLNIPVCYISHLENALQSIAEASLQNTILIMMGAGDIVNFSASVLQTLQAKGGV